MLATRFRTIGWPREGQVTGLLHREIIRQGLLIAARDELGLSTRDQTLQEPFVDADGQQLEPLDIFTEVKLRGRALVELYRGSGDDQEKIWSNVYKFSANSYGAYLTLVPKIEESSRTAMVEALREAGYEGKTNRPAEPAEIPAKVEANLAVMNFVPQFAAVRWAHEDIRTRGESTSSLGVLVRGYSHLSMLTEFYWNTMHLAYKARALLYAERMVVANPDSVEALWYRAYARSMVGMHKAAVVQMEAIAEQTGAEQTGAEPDFDALPTCMRIVGPRCRFDLEQFRAIASEHESLRPLANFLIFRTAESMRDTTFLLAESEAILQNCPDAYGIYYFLYYWGPLGVQRWAVRTGPAMMMQASSARFRGVASLPDSVKELLGGGILLRKAAPSHEVANALVSAGAVGRDIGEPSWAALGRMTQEVSFVQAGILLCDASNAYRSPLGGLVKELSPYVEGHPYESAILALGVDREADPQKRAAIVADLNIVDAQLHMRPFFRMFYSTNTKVANGIGRAAWRECSRDFTAYSMLHQIAQTKSTSGDERIRRMFVRELGKISPYSPDLIRASIVLTPEPSLAELAEWQELAQRASRNLTALGKAHARLGNQKDAVRCFEKSIGVRPSQSACLALADAYVAQGKEDLWLPTLEKFFETDDLGLAHSQMRANIANRLMKRGRWKEAEPYALGAAETGAAWAMLCAANCYEGMGDLEESELWVQRQAMAYKGYSYVTWYLWCCRNGKSNPDVRRQAKLYMDSVGNVEIPTAYSKMATYYLAEGQENKGSSD